jgi:hypothetical protein
MRRREMGSTDEAVLDSDEYDADMDEKVLFAVLLVVFAYNTNRVSVRCVRAHC